ncbi:MAG: Uma2 family endonuclease [Chloroflexota bacterium]|nr:Uma2 family endonuclease [Chloroflexota bacterium]
MPTTLRFTTADVEALPDRLDDTRYELIEGELSVAKQPHWNHQLIGFVLGAALLDWSLRTGLGVANIAPGLIFSAEDNVAPDVVWISQTRLTQGLGDDGKLRVAPELVVEVLSPGATNERRDREAKLKLYALRGAEEYWIVDWRARTVEVYRRAGDLLQPARTLTDADTLTSPLLPGFSYPVGDLWRLARR